jgi:hypothetical protein
MEAKKTINNEKLQQWQEQNDSWKYVLKFLQHENDQLKIRLANLIDRDITRNFLNRAENFHNELMKKDELISHVRIELSDLSDRLRLSFSDNDPYTNEVIRMQAKIRSRIKQMRQIFSRHRTGFSQKLTEYL